MPHLPVNHAGQRNLGPALAQGHLIVHACALSQRPDLGQRGAVGRGPLLPHQRIRWLGEVQLGSNPEQGEWTTFKGPFWLVTHETDSSRLWFGTTDSRHQGGIQRPFQLEKRRNHRRANLKSAPNALDFERVYSDAANQNACSLPPES